MLLGLKDASREVASALNADSATNRLRRLDEAARGLSALAKRPGSDWTNVVRRWSELVAGGVADAQWRQRVEEPIPQVYVADGRPVRPDGRADADVPFKGRAALFRRLEDALGAPDGQRSTYLLCGQRRSGKTSALLQLERRLGAGVLPVFLDLQSEKLGGAADAGGLLHGLAEAIGDEARRRGLGLKPLTRAGLDADPFPAFGRWLDGVEKSLGERRLLVCLDEFEALETGISTGRFDERLLMLLRNIVQHRRRIDVLLSGSRQLDELPPHWAGSLINTQSLPVSFLDPEDARDLIVSSVAGYPDIYAPEAVGHVLALTHRQPYLIQLVCALLVEPMNKARRLPPCSLVHRADVDAVIPLALQRGSGYFVDLWNREVGDDTARRILETLARHPNAAAAGDELNEMEPDHRAFTSALRTLVRRELIARDENARYRIIVPLVAEYVRSQTVL